MTSEERRKANDADARKWRALMATLNNEQNRVDEVRIDRNFVLNIKRETDGPTIYNAWRIYIRQSPV